ncbi:M1 family metallopeptidase [Namhaeicola litoreus]|uniref:M1 family metallopeptidase n=1 Tax=Namhaeicola litoreus TaxID=1052145 RepID=A0ABW3Y2R3_9FLAO
MLLRKCIIIFLFLFQVSFCLAQKYTHQDTLRGSITPERIWWDLLHYDLKINVNPENKSITGSNAITYKVLGESNILQIDLQDPLRITKVLKNDQPLKYTRNGFAYFIELPNKSKIGNIQKLEVFYEGVPAESINPPWTGGFTWEKDLNGKDFIATSCQGIGASIWWPNKDHMYDEPDRGMRLSITCPETVMAIANGRLVDTVDNKNRTRTYVWEVINPINNYGVNVNIGDYTYFSEKYQGIKGELDCDYYVLSYHVQKAKEQFKQVPKMLEAFEYWFGPYPFYEDSFKLVEVPYLGMEHQSSVTYGNGYKNGYLGKDLSGSGWGLKFDFIIIHESGHEWFANNITYRDIADMWIHEGFTAYSETLYVDYHFGKEAGNDYVIGTRKNIRNDKPIIGDYDVNNEGSRDMYPKAANMLHLIRQVMNDDQKFRKILMSLNKDFYHQTVTTEQIENYISEKSKIDFSTVFDQYLRTKNVPILEYKLDGNQMSYRWANVVDGFSIPLKVYVNEIEKWIKPSTDWQILTDEADIEILEIDRNFYVIRSELDQSNSGS